MIRTKTVAPFVALIISSFFATGCAVNYYDAKSGTQHLWGFGHLKTRVSPVNEGVCVQATETETVGLAIDAGSDSYGVSAGYNRQGRLIVSSNTIVRLEWYSRDLFNARAGTNFPFEVATNNSAEPKKKLK